MLTLALTAISLASVLPLPDGAVRFPDTPSYNKRVISPCPRDEKFCESIPDYPFSERVDHDLTENTLIKEKIRNAEDLIEDLEESSSEAIVAEERLFN